MIKKHYQLVAYMGGILFLLGLYLEYIQHYDGIYLYVLLITGVILMFISLRNNPNLKS